MEVLVVLLVGLLLGGCLADVVRLPPAPVARVAFASCHSTRLPVSPIWARILAWDPDVFIFGGDNVYADHLDVDIFRALRERKLPFVRASLDDIERAYANLHALDEYQQLRASRADRLAIWDDHDFGVNDGDKTYPLRHESKRLFLKYMAEANDTDPRWRQKDGVYFSRTYVLPSGGSEDPHAQQQHAFRVILLDVRFEKDPWATWYSSADTSGNMLGQNQWAWLEQELCSRQHPQARVNFIVSGLQVLPEHRGAGEFWALFPSARTRLFNLLRKCRVPAPVLLSGDIHMAEILQATCHVEGEEEEDEDVARRRKANLVEITSSGLTHSWGTRVPQNVPWLNTYMKMLISLCQLVMPWNYRSTEALTFSGEKTRPGAYFLGLNAAHISLDFHRQVLSVAIISDTPPNQSHVLKQEWSFAELDFVLPASPGNVSCGPLREMSFVHLYLARALVASVLFVLPLLFTVRVVAIAVRRLCCRGIKKKKQVSL